MFSLLYGKCQLFNYKSFLLEAFSLRVFFLDTSIVEKLHESIFSARLILGQVCLLILSIIPNLLNGMSQIGYTQKLLIRTYFHSQDNRDSLESGIIIFVVLTATYTYLLFRQFLLLLNNFRVHSININYQQVFLLLILTEGSIPFVCLDKAWIQVCSVEYYGGIWLKRIERKLIEVKWNVIEHDKGKWIVNSFLSTSFSIM